MSDLIQEVLQDERCWTVYVHTNKVNFKRYVGITSRKVEDRWQNDGCGYKRQPFYNAIEKYGWDNFEHEIIASNLTCDEANEFEIMLIRELDSHIERNGYNTTLGGKGTKGCNVDRSMYTGENATNVTKIICLNDMTVYNCAKHACDKYNIDQSSLSAYLLQTKNYKSCGKYNGEKLLWAYYDESKDMGYYEDLKEQQLDKLKAHASTGRNHHNAKSVICLTTNEVFATSKLASEKYSAENIASCCKGKYKHCGKHPVTNEKLQWMYYEDYLKQNNDLEEREAM